MDIIKVFSSNVRKNRLSLGISQEKLAENCGLHRTYISSVERSQRNVSLENVQKIANALGIDVYKLFLEDDADAF